MLVYVKVLQVETSLLTNLDCSSEIAIKVGCVFYIYFYSISNSYERQEVY